MRAAYLINISLVFTSGGGCGLFILPPGFFKNSKKQIMKLIFSDNTLTVLREGSDRKYYGVINAAGESQLLNDIKRELNKQGYDLIKKRMAKDGHLVDDMQQYLRTRKKGAGVADLYIYSGFWAIEGANERFNKGGVVLNVERNVFN